MPKHCVRPRVVVGARDLALATALLVGCLASAPAQPAARPLDAVTSDSRSRAAFLGLPEDAATEALITRRTPDTRSLVTFVADDATTLTARYGTAPGRERADVVLLLHDEGGGHADFDALGLRLLGAGYSVMATEVRHDRGSRDPEAAINWLVNSHLTGTGRLAIIGVGEGSRLAAEVSAVLAHKVSTVVFLEPGTVGGLLGDSVEVIGPKPMMAVADEADPIGIQRARQLQIRNINVIVVRVGMEPGAGMLDSEIVFNRLRTFLETGR
jgi:hypothetical protein